MAKSVLSSKSFEIEIFIACVEGAEIGQLLVAVQVYEVYSVLQDLWSIE